LFKPTKKYTSRIEAAAVAIGSPYRTDDEVKLVGCRKRPARVGA
jgi:hypothetical protein